MKKVQEFVATVQYLVPACRVRNQIYILASILVVVVVHKNIINI